MILKKKPNLKVVGEESFKIDKGYVKEFKEECNSFIHSIKFMVDKLDSEDPYVLAKCYMRLTVLLRNSRNICEIQDFCLFNTSSLLKLKPTMCGEKETIEEQIHLQQNSPEDMPIFCNIRESHIKNASKLSLIDIFKKIFE